MTMMNAKNYIPHLCVYVYVCVSVCDNDVKVKRVTRA